MANRKKTTISDVLGWLLGTGCIVFSMHQMETRDFDSAHNWQLGAWFGIALIILAAWTRKTRNDALRDMIETKGEAAENPLRKAENRTADDLEEAKKLPQEGAHSPGKTSPRDANRGDSA